MIAEVVLLVSVERSENDKQKRNRKMVTMKLLFNDSEKQNFQTKTLSETFGNFIGKP